MEQVGTSRPEQAVVRQSTATHVWWILLVLLIIVVESTAFWFWFVRSPDDGSPEVTFARMMSDHHAQAVEMALIARDRSDDEELRRFALDIMLTQQAQIGQMQGWLAIWRRPLAGPQPTMTGGMPGMATQQEINELQTLPVDEMETSFLQLMIRHHEGGVAMAREALGQTKLPVVTRLAQAIVQGQQSEIAYMQELLKRRGIQPPAPAEPMNMDHTAAP
jgi:uncharacterized protein (DUF305 family)